MSRAPSPRGRQPWSLSLGTAIALPRHLVKKRARGRRRVQARDVAFHGQADPRIAPFFHQPVNALALAADHQADALREVEFPRLHLTPRVERDAPDTGSLDLGDRRRQT